MIAGKKSSFPRCRPFGAGWRCVMIVDRFWKVCAVPEGSERAKRYRHHAEELRTMAANWRDADTLQKLNDLARDYDQMAADLEEAAGTKGPGSNLRASPKN